MLSCGLAAFGGFPFQCSASRYCWQRRRSLYRLPAGFAKMTKGVGSWSWETVRNGT